MSGMKSFKGFVSVIKFCWHNFVGEWGVRHPNAVMPVKSQRELRQAEENLWQWGLVGADWFVSPALSVQLKKLINSCNSGFVVQCKHIYCIPAGFFQDSYGRNIDVSEKHNQRKQVTFKVSVNVEKLTHFLFQSQTPCVLLEQYSEH